MEISIEGEVAKELMEAMTVVDFAEVVSGERH